MYQTIFGKISQQKYKPILEWFKTTALCIDLTEFSKAIKSYARQWKKV